MSLFASRAAALAVAGSGLLFTLSFASSAQAAPCGRPDVDSTFPPDGATGVPTNGVFAAHYAAPALYDNETVDVSDADGNAVPATVTYDDADSLLRVTPDQPLATGQLKIVWPRLRSVGATGGLGRGSTTSFSVGSVADAAPPSFAGLSAIDWDLARDRDPCLDKLDDRFVFTLQVGAASDDLGSDLLQLVVFQTKDPTLPQQNEPTKVALHALPAGGSVEVRRPATKAGDTCFAAVVQDLLGNVSGGGEREVCIKTRKPPFFEGCAVVGQAPGAGAPGSGSSAVLSLLGLWLFRRGRSWGRRPQPDKTCRSWKNRSRSAGVDTAYETKPARPADRRPSKTWTPRAGGPARTHLGRRPRPDKTCRSWKNRSRSAGAAQGS